MNILKNRQGLGMLELLISLALIIAATYYMINRKVASSRSDAANGSIERAQKRLEAQGVQVPANIGAVGAELQMIDQAHEKNIDCRSSESTGCRIENSH